MMNKVLAPILAIHCSMSGKSEQLWLWQEPGMNKAATRWLRAFRFPHFGINTSAKAGSLASIF
jgi:hypothetical protein